MLAKRLFDILCSTVLILLLFPVIVIVAVLVSKKLGRPILFKQTRPGLFGRPFTIYKFRTMKDLNDQDGKPLSDEMRLTKFGKFLRKASLDELPELFNVLLGEMSLVGPRPLLMEYLLKYSKEQLRRHEVRPGITGWAQVHGRNTLDWDKRFQMDVWYVDHRSFGLDLKILWMTFFKVFRCEGISQKGQATMEKFLGSGDE